MGGFIPFLNSMCDRCISEIEANASCPATASTLLHCLDVLGHRDTPLLKLIAKICEEKAIGVNVDMAALDKFGAVLRIDTIDLLDTEATQCHRVALSLDLVLW